MEPRDGLPPMPRPGDESIGGGMVGGGMNGNWGGGNESGGVMMGVEVALTVVVWGAVWML